ncbi:hypothetical protein Y032_0029g1928 [Ancylostoma ceylanicum]|uniref:Uncharacterized protein n=1 Tax=Ancylostoma ceylanicum TaxID=53326 RepID=A0A016USG6_9BILA|nr:hypothetical protein Y032_0029g1928 [Ancylostoma ceylanicum]
MDRCRGAKWHSGCLTHSSTGSGLIMLSDTLSNAGAPRHCSTCTNGHLEFPMCTRLYDLQSLKKSADSRSARKMCASRSPSDRQAEILWENE